LLRDRAWSHRRCCIAIGLAPHVVAKGWIQHLWCIGLFPHRGFKGCVQHHWCILYGLQVSDWVCNCLEQSQVKRGGSAFGKLQICSGGLEARESLDAAKWRFDCSNGEVAEEGAAPSWPTVQLAGVLLARGKWYWEIKVRREGSARIGFMQKKTFIDHAKQGQIA
jgi:hypothetical protein